MFTPTEAAREAKKMRIWNTILNLAALPNTRIVRIDGKDVFEIVADHVFVPDFKFRYCTIKEHYKVYIKVASQTWSKEGAGYCICTIKSGLAAVGFCSLYAFLHRNRAHNKEDSYAS